MAKIKVRWRDLFFIGRKVSEVAELWPDARRELKQIRDDPTIILDPGSASQRLFRLLDEIYQRIKR